MTTEAINRKFIQDNLENIEQVDKDIAENLEMFCFTKCDDNSDELTKQCRGIVFAGDKLVMKTFPYTPEYNESNTEEISKLLGQKVRFFESHEGALIRVFNYNNKWYISTHKKFDAFKSRWSSSESFGTSFYKALESEYSTNDQYKKLVDEKAGSQPDMIFKLTSSLDVKKQYMFLVLNNSENRIVCNTPETPKLYHVGVFDDGKLDMSVDIKIAYPQEIKFSSTDEVVDYVNKVDIKKLQGLVCVGESNIVCKILSSKYQEYFRVRGNEPSVKFRYLQVRMNKDYVNKLAELYPTMIPAFKKYYDVIFTICQNIYRAYVDRFIKKRYVIIPKEEYFVMKQCHEWYMSDPETHRISLEKVVEIVNKQTPVHVNRMIKNYL